MVKPDCEPKRISRRNFLKLGAATGGAVVLATTDLGGVIETVGTVANGIGNLVSTTPTAVSLFKARKDSVATVESAQYTQIHIEFDIQSVHYAWDITGASWGINPPNDSSRRTGTVRVALNDIWYSSKSFQPLVNEILYPEIRRGPGVGVGVGGMAVDISLDKYYLGTSVSRTDGNNDPRLEIGNGIETPEKYTNRIVIRKGLPASGIKGLMTSSLVILGSDDTGNYVDYIFSDCINTTENGTYRIRRDNVGNLVGDTFVKISDSITPGKPFRIVLPEYMQKAQQ